jgi:hypothetical protein
LSRDENLQEILDAWSNALGTPERLRAQSAVALQGTVAFVSQDGLGLCGTLEAFYTDRGDFRLNVLVAGCSYMSLVFDLRRDRGWSLDPERTVSALPPGERRNLVGLLYLLTYSWRFPERVPGKVRLVEEDRRAAQYVLETEARKGTPFTVRLGMASSLPEQISCRAAELEKTPFTHPRLPARRLRIGKTEWELPSLGGRGHDKRDETLEIAIQSWLESAGIQFPSRLVMTSSGSPGQAIVAFQAAQVNPPLPQGIFNKPSPPGSGIHFVGGGTRTRVPIDLVTNNVFVATSVNGNPALSFGLDTGTSVVAIDQAVAKRLGIRCVCHFKNLLGGGTRPSESCVTSKMNLRVGLLEAGRHGLGLGLTQLSHDKIGQPVDGILGGTLLGDLLVDINYPEGWAELCDPQDRPGFPGVTIPMSPSGGTPFVRARLALPHGETEALLMVDTGTQEALILNHPFVEKHHLLKISPQISTIDFGLAGAVPYAVCRLARVRLGPLEIVNPVVNLAKVGAGSLGSTDFDGFLGAEVLMRTRVAFDYRRRAMRVAPGTDFAAPYEFGMSGMVLVTRPPGYHDFVVAYVIADSPAQQADIRIGDEINSIDGRPAARLTLSGIKEMFTVPGRRYVLGVSTKGVQRTVEIVTRRLI